MDNKTTVTRENDLPGSQKRGVIVSIGYGWNGDTKDISKGYEVLGDPYWISLKEEFSGMCKTVADKSNCRVDLRRLRATYGHPILDSILSHIRHSDVLVLDLGSIRKNFEIPREGKIGSTKVFDRLNCNVLFELGAAQAYDIPSLIMCPEHLRKLLPSDMSGYLISFYSGYFEGGKFVRKCVDKRGLQAAFRSMIKEAVENVNDMTF